MVFDGHSGQTHLLTELAGLLVSELLTGAQSEMHLRSTISSASGMGDEESLAYVRSTLQSLHSLGLIALTSTSE